MLKKKEREMTKLKKKTRKNAVNSENREAIMVIEKDSDKKKKEKNKWWQGKIKDRRNDNER